MFVIARNSSVQPDMTRRKRFTCALTSMQRAHRLLPLPLSQQRSLSFGDMLLVVGVGAEHGRREPCSGCVSSGYSLANRVQ